MAYIVCINQLQGRLQTILSVPDHCLSLVGYDRPVSQAPIYFPYKDVVACRIWTKTGPLYIAADGHVCVGLHESLVNGRLHQMLVSLRFVFIDPW